MKAKKTKPGRTERPEAKSDLTDRIARRAQEMYLERGGEHGHDLGDWLRAEKEILESRKKVKEK